MSSNPDPIDIYVGSRVRMRRTLIGMSQEKLGAALNLTFQQIQKYERGANRIGSSNLYRISRLLGVSVNYFFEGVHDKGHNCENGFAEQGAPAFDNDTFSRRETIELVRAYYKIHPDSVRKGIVDVIKTVGLTLKDQT